MPLGHHSASGQPFGLAVLVRKVSLSLGFVSSASDSIRFFGGVGNSGTRRR